MDKLLHLLAGFFIFQIMFFILLWQGFDINKILMLSMLVVTLAGIAKEVYDFFMPNHNVELSDFLFTFFGGVIGALIFIVSLGDL